jgi:hypothetical protein
MTVSPSHQQPHDGGFIQFPGSLVEKLLIVNSGKSGQEPTRPPGRPRTRTDAHYVRLLQEYAHLSDWFVETFGRRARSDAELLTAHVATRFEQRGMRPSRATSPDMKRKLKTLRNELSTARRMVRPYPENSLLPGCQTGDSNDMQERALTSKGDFYAR